MSALETNTISAAGLAAMKGGKTYTFSYADAARFLNALRHAYWIRRNKPRPDGGTYRIENIAARMMIIIRVEPKK